MFFLIDTLEAHKAEKQRLPMAGKKHVLKQNYDLIYKTKLHHKDTWPSHQVIFSMLHQFSNIQSDFFSELFLQKNILILPNDVLN